MANADDFRPEDDFDNGSSELHKRILELEEEIGRKRETLIEKDRLLDAYWNSIQSMRLTSRLRRLVGLSNKRDPSFKNYSRANRKPLFRTGRNGIRICIKIPVYNWKVADTWGDYYFALGIRRHLLALGYEVMVQTLEEWYNDRDLDCQVILVLRGLSPYKPRTRAVHLMWNISHPEAVTMEEYSLYDHVFVASVRWAEELKQKVATGVTALLQCTDLSVFRPAAFPVRSKLLFIGNSKGILRPIIRDLLPTDQDLQIYGMDWDDIVDARYVKGTFIRHDKLARYYSGADILLNDHWEDMKRLGFISNRIFDALACGAFVISDAVVGLDEIFGNAVVTYDSPADLRTKVLYYSADKSARKAIAERGRKLVGRHTFRERVLAIHEIIAERIVTYQEVKHPNG